MEEEKLIEAKGLEIFDYTIVAFVCNFYKSYLQFDAQGWQTYNG